MSGQDWGGRRKMNPDNCKTVTAKTVRNYAAELGFEVYREGPGNGTWWVLINGGYITAGATNYLCVNYLKMLAGREARPGSEG